MTCIFGELSVVKKCFQAEKFSSLRAPGVSVFKPVGKKIGFALDKVHQFPTAKGSRYFQSRYGKKEDLPITYVLQYQGSSDLTCVSRHDKECAQQHNLDSKKTGTNRVPERMARFFKQLSRVKSFTSLESLVKLRCVVRVIMPENLIPRTSVSCLYRMFLICFDFSLGPIDNVVHLWISILALVAFSYILLLNLFMLA